MSQARTATVGGGGGGGRDRGGGGGVPRQAEEHSIAAKARPKSVQQWSAVDVQKW